jgi:aspartate oxidase
MKVERRDTNRVSVELEVMLSPDTHGYQLSRTRDISLDGAFVETKSKPPKNATVELALKLSTNGKTRVHRVTANVVRSTANGIALAFDDVDTDAYAALLELVFANHPKSEF